MVAAAGSSNTRRRVRAELRGMREASGMSVDEATERASWPSAKLNQIEQGEIEIAPSDLAVLLALYKIGDAAVIESINELARSSSGQMWWTPYRPYLPDPYLQLIVAEADAIAIRTFNTMFVPGLLQTRAYATEITLTTTLKDTPLEVSQARIEARMRRQREVLNGRHPCHLLALIDEAVLYRPVGPAETMREQLDHLDAMGDNPNVTLVIVPRLAGPHPGQLGTYMLFEYADAYLEDLLFFEGAMGNTAARGRPDLVAAYQGLSDRLVSLAKAKSSRQLISMARSQHR